MNSIAAAIIAQTYKEYKNIILNKYFGVITIKPMMKYRETAIIEDILENFHPGTSLEWGSGYSTLYFPSFLNKNALWYSFEHNKEWSEKVREINKNPNVTISYVKPNAYPWTDADNDGAYSDLKDYIELPEKWGEFDLILIDGRARNACLKKALDILADGGIVIMHDANRKYYHQSFAQFRHKVYFENYRKSYGLFIGSKETDIRTILDVDKHLKLWDVYNAISRIFHKRKMEKRLNDNRSDRQ